MRARDIVVLELKSAKNEVLPNPQDSRILRIGDRLLCFGKLDAMRELAPAPPRRRPRKLSSQRPSDGTKTSHARQAGETFEPPTPEPPDAARNRSDGARTKRE